MSYEYVNAKILRLCHQPRSFEFLSKSLDGLDPIKVDECLKNLVAEGRIVLRHDLWGLPESAKPLSLDLKHSDTQLYLKKYMGYFDFLKTPHPLDFEWRNSSASLLYLVSLIQKVNKVNDKVLLLGMPTLFATSCIKEIPQKITLVERNKPIVQALSNLSQKQLGYNIIEVDIFNVDPSSVGSYYSVIMDPPWYSPQFYQFMWLASKCVQVGGLVAISLPPLSTRPNISSERIEWFAFCNKLGLCIESLQSQKLHYTMPFFEFNALRAAGITNLLPFWRMGDLAIFRKIELSEFPRPEYIDLPPIWGEREIDNVRIRVKNSSIVAQSEPLKIDHLVAGDILPNMSSRDPLRAKANVMTSGNRIYSVNDSNTFFKLLGELQQKRTEFSSDRKTVIDFVNHVCELEKKEYDNYLEWLYHEMERETAWEFDH